MEADYQIPEPVLFNLIKHHLGYIRDFIDNPVAFTLPGSLPAPLKGILLQRLKHIGTTVMDVYTGKLSVRDICEEITEHLRLVNLLDFEKYSVWTGRNPENYRTITLSDESEWTMKFHNEHNRYVHIFPARNSRYTFRVKGNTLKTALIYLILIGKDMITGEDLNRVRPYLGLSPVKDAIEAKAIVEMIEILRG